MTSANDERCGIRIIHITDTYTLSNFPHVKSLLTAKREEFKAVGDTITVHTGDFLAPYTLSSFDKGAGMIACFNALPVDYVMWGNHEDDVEHRFGCQRTRDFKGTWLNSNMRGHDTFAETQTDSAIRLCKSADGTHTRKIGMIAVLSNDPSLYRHGAFGGATIDDPWETLGIYKDKLLNKDKVDLVLPLSHLYVPQDLRTCKEFDFPVILGGHDHHVVNEVHHGTRLCKPGADAKFAMVVDIIWDSADATAPTITTEVLKVSDFPADAALQEVVAKCETVLVHLKKSEICLPPPRFQPLDSRGARERVVSAATFLCSAVKTALNTHGQSKDHTGHCVDAVIITGGSIGRGNRLYKEGEYFSLEHLDSELDTSAVIVAKLPAKVVAVMVQESHAVAPNSGFLQTDEQVEFDESGRVVRLNGKDLDEEAMYRIGITEWDCHSGPSKTLSSYCAANPGCLASHDSGFPLKPLLLSYFAGNVWKSIFARLDKDGDGKIDADMMRCIDTDGDGEISSQELGVYMQKLGMSVDLEESAFLDTVLATAGDDDRDGTVSAEKLRAPSPVDWQVGAKTQKTRKEQTEPTE